MITVLCGRCGDAVVLRLFLDASRRGLSRRFVISTPTYSPRLLPRSIMLGKAGKRGAC